MPINNASFSLLQQILIAVIYVPRQFLHYRCNLYHRDRVRRSHSSRSLADKQHNFKFIDIIYDWHQLLFKETSHDITGNKQIIFMFRSRADFSSRALTITSSQAVLYGGTPVLWKRKIHRKVAEMEVQHFFSRVRSILLHRCTSKEHY